MATYTLILLLCLLCVTFSTCTERRKDDSTESEKEGTCHNEKTKNSVKCEQGNTGNRYLSAEKDNEELQQRNTHKIPDKDQKGKKGAKQDGHGDTQKSEHDGKNGPEKANSDQYTADTNANEFSQNNDEIKLEDDPASWPGHMEPLASKTTNKYIELYKRFPKPFIFQEDFVQPYSVLLMKGALKGSQAFKKWRFDKYFLSVPQAATTWITIPMNGTSHTITFRRFIQLFGSNKSVEYDDDLPLFMQEEMPLPAPLLCTPVMKQLSNHRLVFTQRNTSTGLSQDLARDHISCVVSGQMDAVLVDFKKFAEKIPADFSTIDTQQVNFTKFPSVRELRYQVATLEEGDCLYIPAKWYYNLKSTGRLVAVEVQWYHNRRQSVSSPTQCGRHDKQSATLNKFTFQDITAVPSSKDDGLFHYFGYYLTEKESFTPKEFENQLKNDKKILKDMITWDNETAEIAQELFDHLDVNSDNVFSTKDLDDITLERLYNIRGLLEDRVADLEDIMRDQQTDARSGQVDQFTTEYMKKYTKHLESLVNQGIKQFMKEQKPTVKLPRASGKTKQESEHSTSKEEATPKIKVADKNRKGLEPQDGEFKEPDQNYVIVEEEQVEEILAEDEEKHTPTSKLSIKTKKADRHQKPQTEQINVKTPESVSKTKAFNPKAGASPASKTTV